MTERWLPVVGYEGWYEVSDHGRVRRIKPGTRGTGFLNPFKNDYGYLKTTISNGSGARDRRRAVYIHHLVAEAFIGPRPPGFTVNHIDGVKTNNRPENLEYLSRSDNLRHAGRMGLMAHGERARGAKLTEDDVREIRRLAPEKSWTQIAKQFEISAGHVSMIVNRRIWKRVA